MAYHAVLRLTWNTLIRKPKDFSEVMLMDKSREPAQRHPMAELSHLLLVDDDPALLDALCGTLHARFGHFSVDACDSGARALELAKQQQYDTIIVDVNMPN